MKFPHQFGPVLHRLQQLVLAVAQLALVVALQPGLDGPAETHDLKTTDRTKKGLSGIPVLLVEVVHVRHEVLDHVHVGERVDLGLLVVGLDLAAKIIKP